MPYIVKKAVQDYARRNNMKVSADFYAAMDKEIDALLSAAALRCRDNKRKTLKAYDL
jgi:histone H3/H4